MNNPNTQHVVSPGDDNLELCMQRKLAALYLVHVPVNFSDMLALVLSGEQPPCPIFFADHEARACVYDAALLRLALEKVAARFPEPQHALQYLYRQYDARGTPTQKVEYLVVLIEGVRQRTNVRASSKKSLVRSSYNELKYLCEGKGTNNFLGHIDSVCRTDRRGHRVTPAR